ncbi:MAG: hypothetical protein Q8877_03035, partial [Sweet potato little leaf phytoplasma]|nr:hypothetical protein [Sweet potato little leaf phytoplasma]
TIIGEKSRDYKDASLKVPCGESGIVQSVHLERKLQDVWVGSYKVQINKPKYERPMGVNTKPLYQERVSSRQGTKMPTYGPKEHVKTVTEGLKNTPWKNALMSSGMHGSNKGKGVIRVSGERGSKVFGWNGLCFQPSKEEMEDLQDCFIGKTLRVSDAFNFQEILFKEGFFSIKFVPMGGILFS